MEAQDAPSPYPKIMNRLNKLISKNIFQKKSHGGQRPDFQTQDTYRVLLVNLAHLLSSYLSEALLFDGVSDRKNLLPELQEIFKQLSQIPCNDRTVHMVCRRFSTGANIPEKMDYLIVYGNVVVDTKIASAMNHRMGITMAHLVKRLEKSFEALWQHGVSTLLIKVPGKNVEEIEYLELSLQILSLYRHAFQTGSPISITKGNFVKKIPLILDENGMPDPNLTMVAGLNDLSSDTLLRIIEKVYDFMSDHEEVSESYPNVYRAIFAFKGLRERLIRPPIEINTVKWEIVDRVRKQVKDRKEALSTFELIDEDIQQKIEADVQLEQKKVKPEPLQTKVKTESSVHPRVLLNRLILKHFGEVPEDSDKIIESIYGGDYRNPDMKVLSERIWAISILLDIIKENSEPPELEEEVFRNFRQNFEQIPPGLLEQIKIEGTTTVKVHVDDNIFAIDDVNPRLIQLIYVTQSQIFLKNKMKDIIRYDSELNDRDYGLIGREFNISESDAKEILKSLKSCFDTNGRFLKSMFEKNILEFERHENKIFEFMWHYLKESIQRKDRVEFLNSLQLLIAKMSQPKKAIKVLLTDALKNPDIVQFSDRNAFILCNLLIRKYNKEKNLDIEMTPEEVLLVKDGLDEEVSMDVSRVLDQHQERFLTKLTMIYDKILETMNPLNRDLKPLPLRYLLSLERETYIFLSLIGGELSQRVLRDALKRYGTSSSKVYTFKDTRHNLSLFFQHLKVVVRALGRVGTDEDLPLLEMISEEERPFLNLSDDSMFREKLKQVMEWIYESKLIIARKSMYDDRDIHAFRAS